MDPLRSLRDSVWFLWDKLAGKGALVLAVSLEGATLALTGHFSSVKSRKKSLLVALLAGSLLTVQGVAGAVTRYAPGVVEVVRDHWRTCRVLVVYVLVECFLSLPLSKRKTLLVLKLLLSQVVAVTTLQEPPFLDAYLSLAVIILLSRETRKEVAHRSLGLLLALIGLNAILLGLFMRYVLFPWCLRRSYLFLYTGTHLISSGLLMDDLQSLLHQCDRHQNPSFGVLSQMICCIFIIFYSHAGLRSMQTPSP